MQLDALHSEMVALFSAFLPAELASRFSELLQLKPSHWQKIDPWRVWQYTGSGSVVEWHGNVQTLLSSPPFLGHAVTQVTVLRCGHERPSIQRLPLQEALVGESAVFEGFISVVTGRLGLAINHDGMLCVLSR